MSFKRKKVLSLQRKVDQVNSQVNSLSLSPAAYSKLPNELTKFGGLQTHKCQKVI